MKLYYHPASTACRPIMLWAADEGVVLDMHFIDLFKGDHKKPFYLAVNPCGQVPTLVDGDFRLSEGSAILKYLAEKTGSPAYPGELTQRARVNEVMDWFNTGFYRDLGYGFVYAQALPQMIYPDAAVQSATLERARTNVRKWLGVLDHHLLGPSNKYLCGDAITLADYLGVCYMTVGEVVHVNYDAWPNITRWMGTMKAGANWAKVNAAFYEHFVGAYKDGRFLAL
jgi:glutathione S-transferase